MSTSSAVAYYAIAAYTPVYYPGPHNTPWPRIDLTRRSRVAVWRALLDELRQPDVTSRKQLYRMGWRVQKIAMRFEYPGRVR